MASMAGGFHHDDVEVGFEEGMLWLPSHVFDEACGNKVYTRNRIQKVQNHHHHQMHHQQHNNNHKSSREPRSQYSSKSSTTSSSMYNYQRPKVVGNGGIHGNGMQAIFLGSGQRSCGTGVFLPQRLGTNSNFNPTKNKPACAPVLLPARVVQALNLNVHALGVQISRPQVHKYNPRCGELYNNNISSTKKKSDQKDAFENNQSSSPEIFLPKEWTY